MKIVFKPLTQALSLIFSLLLISYVPYATAALTDFVIDPNTGCKIYNYTKDEANITWSGACVAGKISGPGILTVNFLQNNDICTQTGEFKEGLRDGQVKTTCTDGSAVEGLYKGGEMNGKGWRTGSEGDRWEGEFKNGELIGEGTHTLAKLAGYKYHGTFKNYKYDGQGIQTFSDGERRVGEFKDGQQITGMATFPDKSKYEGEFKNGASHGKGKYTYEFGTTYTGDFENGRFHGHGRLIFVHGDYQIGLFQNGTFISSMGTEKYSGTLDEYRKRKRDEAADESDNYRSNARRLIEEQLGK